MMTLPLGMVSKIQETETLKICQQYLERALTASLHDILFALNFVEWGEKLPDDNRINDRETSHVSQRPQWEQSSLAGYTPPGLTGLDLVLQSAVTAPALLTMVVRGSWDGPRPGCQEPRTRRVVQTLDAELLRLCPCLLAATSCVR